MKFERRSSEPNWLATAIKPKEWLSADSCQTPGGSVNKGSFAVFENQVQGETRIISTLAVVTSVASCYICAWT